MNPRITWFLVLLACGLGAFIFWNELPRNSGNKTEDPALQALPAFTAENVTSVEVHMRTNLIFHADRTNNEWKLTLPFSFPANAARIEGLLPVFAQLNSRSNITAQELQAKKQPLSAFGLDPPVARLIVQQDTNQWELRIGGKTLVENQVYVQLVGSEGIYFTSAGFLDRLPQSVDDWRDPYFLRTKVWDFNRIEVKTGAGGFELQVDSSTGLWKISRPLEARANNVYIGQLLESLKNWKIAKFVDAGPNLDLETYGLRPPESTLTLGRGTNTSLVAYFGKSPTNDDSLVYAYCSERQPAVVLVPKECLENKLRVPAPYILLRDPRLLPVSLAGTELIEIESQGSEKFSVENTSKGGWVISGPDKVAVDPELMRNFLGDITTASIIGYEKDVATDFDFTTAGLIPPKRRYVFRSFLTDAVRAETNKIITLIEFGIEQNGKVFARIPGENSIYAARPELVKLLPTQPFQLWDRQMWHFTTNDVTSLTVAVGGQTNGIVRDAAHQWRYVDTSRRLDSMMTNILEEFLFRLGNLRAESWVVCGEDKMKLYGFPILNCHISVGVSLQGKPQNLELDLGSQSPSQNTFAATVWNGKKVVFELPISTFHYFRELARYWAAAIGESPGTPAKR